MNFLAASFLTFLALTAFFAAKTRREVREIIQKQNEVNK